MAIPATDGLSGRALVARLADGHIQSGERLALALGVSRTAVWKGIERLRAAGIAVEALPRRGYRLPEPVELLETPRLLEAIEPRRRLWLRSVEIPFAVESTNSRLLARDPPPFGVGDACLCELQSAGRGRRGRNWIAPFGAGIALSLGWQYREMPRDLPALSLAVGVAVVRALDRAGAIGIGLKWPNDIWLRDAKLGGILIDLRAEADGPAFVVIGIGVNLALSAAARATFADGGVKAAAVADACAAPPSRNLTVGLILDELLQTLVEFEHAGFAPYRQPWAALDVLAGRSAVVSAGDQRIAGTARGIDEDGALRLDVGGDLRRFVAGDVSLRPEGGVA